VAPIITNAAETWASIYAASPALRTVVSFAHIAGLVGGGGCAIAADRAALVAWRSGASERESYIRWLPRTHRAVLAGLVAVIISGAMLAFADLDTYWASRAFWIKMAFVAVLLLNGAVLARAGQRVARGDTVAWHSLRVTSILSLFLWFVTTLIGAALPNAL